MPDTVLAIVIVNWNTRDDLLACLGSLREARLELSHELWVVDNASTDGSADAVAAAHPEVRLVRAGRNLGYAAANNEALARTQARHVLLLNPDTLVAAGQLEALVAHLEAHPEVGVVGPRLVYGDGSFQLSAMPFVEPGDVYWEHARFPGPLQPRSQREPRRLYTFLEDAAREVDMVIGAALVIRREALDRVGPLDAGYFMYGEEMDWCHRVRAAGYKVVWLPTAVVTHLGGRSAAHVPLASLANRYAGTFRYLRLHRGAGAARRARALLAAAVIQNALLGTARVLAGRQPFAAWVRDLAEARVALATALAGRAAGVGPRAG